MRCIKWLIAAAAGLLAACSSVVIPGLAGIAAVEGASLGNTPAGGSRSWTEYKLRAARRIRDANAGETFSGPLPDPLQSIPVLEVRLNRDGSVQNIVVLRTPKQSPETVQLAMRAIRRAAPFEPVGHLPRPWQFSETFLYNEAFKFQLRTLAEAP